MTRAGTILGGGRFGSSEGFGADWNVLLWRSVLQNCAYLELIVRALIYAGACTVGSRTAPDLDSSISSPTSRSTTSDVPLSFRHWPLALPIILLASSYGITI